MFFQTFLQFGWQESACLTPQNRLALYIVAISIPRLYKAWDAEIYTFITPQKRQTCRHQHPVLKARSVKAFGLRSMTATHSSGTTAHWTALTPATKGQSALSYTPQWLETVQRKRQASFREASLLFQFSSVFPSTKSTWKWPTAIESQEEMKI